MERVVRLRALPRVRDGERARQEAADVPLPLRIGDAVLTAWCSFVAVWLWTVGRWAPDATESAIAYTILALGPLVFRTLAYHFYRLRHLTLVANFWLLPALVFGHCYFGPFVDAINPRLYDAQLARMDGLLFGAVPSLFTEPFVKGLAMDALLLCYYSYFLWPFLLAIVLYVKNRAAFSEFRVAMILFFVANFALYTIVPAIGPRFFLAGNYAGPLQGATFITPYLDGLMRVTPFNRDCFPSGHTGFTLIVLSFAFMYSRRFFAIMVVPAMGLIAATVLGRFHYGIDLICAVPLVLVVVSTATFIARAPVEASAKKLAVILRRAAQLGTNHR